MKDSSGVQVLLRNIMKQSTLAYLTKRRKNFPLNDCVLTKPQWLETMTVTRTEAQQQYFYCISFQTKIHAVVADNQNTTVNEKREQKTSNRMVGNKILHTSI